MLQVYIVGTDCLNGCFPSGSLAAAHLPESFLLIVKCQQAIARVVPLAALRARIETADVHSLSVVVLGNGKAGTATAGDQEHAKILPGFSFGLVVAGLHGYFSDQASAFDRRHRSSLALVRLQYFLA